MRWNSVGAAHKVTEGRTETEANATVRSAAQPRLRAFGLLLLLLLLSDDRCFPPMCTPQTEKLHRRRSVSLCSGLPACLPLSHAPAGGFQTRLQETAPPPQEIIARTRGWIMNFPRGETHPFAIAPEEERGSAWRVIKPCLR